MTTRRREHSSKWIDKEETGKHNLASSTECSAPASYQYYPASKTGGATKDMMKKSLERRYPPPCGSWNTRAEAATHHVGSRNTVRSFTQPFALPSNIPNRRTAQYPAPTSASSVVAQQVPRRTTSLGNSHHVDYDSESRSPPPGRKPRIRTHISPKPEPEYEVNCFKPPSTMESCPNCPTYDDRGRNTYKTGKARMTGMRTEKPLPPLTPRTTAGEEVLVTYIMLVGPLIQRFMSRLLELWRCSTAGVNESQIFRPVTTALNDGHQSLIHQSRWRRMTRSFWT
jgi:hypothetical protein